MLPLGKVYWGSLCVFLIPVCESRIISIKISIKKMSKRFKQILYQKRYTDAKWAYETNCGIQKWNSTQQQRMNYWDTQPDGGFHRYCYIKVRQKKNTHSMNQNSSLWWIRGLTRRGSNGPWWGNRNSLFWLGSQSYAWVYTSVETQPAEHLRSVHLTVYIAQLRKTGE